MKSLRIGVLISLASTFLMLPAAADIRKFVAPNPAQLDNFGLALAAEGGVVVIGIPQDDDPEGSGAVAVWDSQLEPGVFTPLGPFKASAPQAASFYGSALSFSANQAFVGATHENNSQGAVHLLVRDTVVPGNWIPAGELTAPNPETFDRFGNALAHDGSLLVVGARFASPVLPLAASLAGGEPSPCGEAHVFQKIGEAWVHQAALDAQEDCSNPGPTAGFGAAVAIDGERVAVGSDSGRIYLFEKVMGSWQRVARISPPAGPNDDYAQFGSRLALEGDRLLAASWHDQDGFPGNRAYIYEKIAGTWSEAAILIAGDPPPLAQFGQSVALQGDYALIGCPVCPEGSGAATGAVYLFERQMNGSWAQVRRLLGSGGAFGVAVELDGLQAWVGAHLDTDGVTAQTGAAYLIDILPAIFADGFESGDLSGWSAAVP